MENCRKYALFELSDAIDNLETLPTLVSDCGDRDSIQEFIDQLSDIYDKIQDLPL